MRYSVLISNSSKSLRHQYKKFIGQGLDTLPNPSFYLEGMWFYWLMTLLSRDMKYEVRAPILALHWFDVFYLLTLPGVQTSLCLVAAVQVQSEPLPYTSLSIPNLRNLKRPMFPFYLQLWTLKWKASALLPNERAIKRLSISTEKKTWNTVPIQSDQSPSDSPNQTACLCKMLTTSCNNGQINPTDFFRLSQVILDQVSGRNTVSLFDNMRRPEL